MCAEGRGAGAVTIQAQGEDHNFGCKQGSSLNCAEFLSQMPDFFKIVALQWKDIEFQLENLVEVLINFGV